MTNTNMPIVLISAIQEMRHKEYKELYQETDSNNDLWVDVKNVLNLLQGETKNVTYCRYLWMGLIIGFAVKPTVLAYLPNDLRPSLILKRVKALFFREQSKYLCYKSDLVLDEEDYSYYISQLEGHLFPYKFEGSQALDEALDVFWNLLRMMDTQLVEEALIEILDNCFDGYAIFPGSQYRKDLFDWWLRDVIPSIYKLSFPKELYTIEGLVEFTSEHFLEI